MVLGFSNVIYKSFCCYAAYHSLRKAGKWPFTSEKTMMKILLTFTLLACLSSSALAHEAKSDSTPPATLPPAIVSPASAGTLQAALNYASFWNTGDASYAELALAPDFLDRTLPTGRPQGKPGVLQASNGFRQAVPDLRASVEDLIISGDKVVLRLRFTGHFTGKLGTKQGQGQLIDFAALDLYRIQQGKIKENWHLEDMQRFFEQIN